jgi:hypothetical protein
MQALRKMGYYMRFYLMPKLYASAFEVTSFKAIKSQKTVKASARRLHDS